MTIELNPEQERIIQQQLTTGQFNSVEEVLTTALSTLPKCRSDRTAVQRMIQFSKENSVKLPPGETVEELVRSGHRL